MQIRGKCLEMAMSNCSAEASIDGIRRQKTLQNIIFKQCQDSSIRGKKKTAENTLKAKSELSENNAKILSSL